MAEDNNKSLDEIEHEWEFKRKRRRKEKKIYISMELLGLKPTFVVCAQVSTHEKKKKQKKMRKVFISVTEIDFQFIRAMTMTKATTTETTTTATTTTRERETNRSTEPDRTHTSLSVSAGSSNVNASIQQTQMVFTLCLFRSRSGTACQLNCKFQSKPPTFTPPESRQWYSIVVSSITSMTGHTTVVLFLAMRSSNGSSQPVKNTIKQQNKI